ncbi:hypothetical protein [Hellea balneolensis]|uniref:hypothetical protein n=1 Tax=Hellea balneolensis TaxID=287478 RepID=UPI0004789B33|nr:hypothetical protein [Hellea balneolensis]
MTRHQNRIHHILLGLTFGGVLLAACSTQGASRYGDETAVNHGEVCGTVMVPCGPILQYPAVPVSSPIYSAPVPCFPGACETLPIPTITKPVEPSPPIVTDPPYVPPVISEPYPTMPSNPDPIACPEGSILGYGGDSCIPIAVPRK